jgi:hypothetical protein
MQTLEIFMLLCTTFFNGQYLSIEPEESNRKGFCVSLKVVKQLKSRLYTISFQNFILYNPLKIFDKLHSPFQNK